MANRNIQAKILKMKKARLKARLHLPADTPITLADHKPFTKTLPARFQGGYISAGAPPNRLVIAEYKQRAKSLGAEEPTGRFKNVPPGRLQAQKKADRLADEERLEELCPNKLFFSLLDNNYQSVRLYYNIKKTVFVLRHEDKKKKIIRTSISFSSRYAAEVKWNMNKVIWVESVSSNEQSS